MIAAIYARKSNDQSVSEDAKSVTRQRERAQAFIAAKGWALGPVFSDDGVSGALFGDSRPGFAQLLAALHPKPAFDILVTMDEARLGRDRVRSEMALATIIEAGVGVWFYLASREAKVDDATSSFMEGVRLYAAQQERETGRARTRDALARKAERGHVPGGKVYGYVNREIGTTAASGQAVRDHVEREIDPVQAEVVRRIFHEVAAARGFSRIAKLLNAERIPAPRPNRGWAKTGVRELVFRDLYRGRVIWGKTRWVYRGGRKVKEDRPESEWIVREMPELRIITDAEWDAAHARIGSRRRVYLRQLNGQLIGRPESGIESKYLLTGFLTCGACGYGMHATRRTDGSRGHSALYYVCTTHRERGNTCCPNRLAAPLKALDALVLTHIETEILNPEMVERMAARAVEGYLDDHSGDPRQALELEATRLETEIAQYAEAIGLMGARVPEVVAQLAARQRKLTDVRTRLHRLADGPGALSAEALVPEIRRRLSDLSGLAHREPAYVRQILRKFLVGRYLLTPEITPSGRFYEIRGQASYGRLLTNLLSVKGVVPPG